MRAVDTAVLALLGATGVDVNDGFVDVERESGSPRVVTQRLPFLVYYSNLGHPDGPRLSGRNCRESVLFQVTYVGIDRNQAKAAGERQRAALEGKRLTIAGRKSWLIVLEESQRVRRDDDAIRADGSPLFYGVDVYTVSLTRTPT